MGTQKTEGQYCTVPLILKYQEEKCSWETNRVDLYFLEADFYACASVPLMY